MFRKKKEKTEVVKKAPQTKEEIAYANKIISSRTWVVTVVIALIGAYILLRPYMSVILLGTLMAVLFNGVYQGFLKRFKGSRPKAALLVSVYSVFAFGIPVLIILAIAFSQASQFISSLELGDVSLSDTTIKDLANTIVESINSVARSVVGVDPLVNSAQVTDFLQTVIPEVLDSLVNLLVSFTKSIPALFMNAIIYFFVFTGLLVNQKNIAKYLRDISPFSKELNDKYATRAAAMSKAMLKGQLLIAFCQGFVGALSLALIGFSDYFVFFLLIFTLMNMIPLGSGIILIPLGIVLVLTGNVWQGLFILGVHFIVTTNIDNYIRPKVVPKDAWIPASLTIISALGGVVLFGLMGVVYGPIIAILIMTTLEEYAKMKRKQSLEA